MKPSHTIAILMVAAAIMAGLVLTRPQPEQSRQEDPTIVRLANYEIHRSQLERACHEAAWLVGKDWETLADDEKEKISTQVQRSLVDDALLEHHMAKNPPLPEVSENELNERMRRFASRFQSREAMRQATIKQGITDEKALYAWITGQIQREKFLAKMLEEKTMVTTDDARAWYAARVDEIARPERIFVRHIFISTLNRPSADARAMLEGALEILRKREKSFAAIASEMSEDYANQKAGGELGWMSRERLPPDLADQFFALRMGEPVLVQSKIGWHLAELLDRKPREVPTFEESEAEITAALKSKAQADVAIDFLKELRELYRIEMKTALHHE